LPPVRGYGMMAAATQVASGHQMSDLGEASRKLVAVFAADVEGYSRLGRRSGGSLSNPYEGHCGAQAGAANIAGSSASAEFASASAA
jgi:adenylate cyclase